MKKSLLFVALTGAALVSSCVSDEVVNVQEQQKQVRIGFSSPVLYENAESRANKFGEITGTYSYLGSVGTYTYPREECFLIYAIEHTGDFTFWPNNSDECTSSVGFCEFNGDRLTYDSNVDAWAPKTTDDKYYYWPSGKKLSFAALSPADLETKEDPKQNSTVTPLYGSTGFTITNFEIPDAPSQQYDLMYSERNINNTSANNLPSAADKYSGIPITFKHALSSIHFSLMKDATVTEDVILKSIVVKNAYKKGTFKENYGLEKDPEWEIDETVTQNYTAYLGTVLFPIQPQYVSALEAMDEESDGVVDDSHALLLMPQYFTEDLTIEVSYKVGNSELIVKPIQVNLYPNIDGVSPLEKWEMGKRYTYRLYYSKESEKQDIIYFAPSVEGWDPVETIIVRL